mmetsp:Transcript_17945/g.58103  ORF Transcript_17945/g.58103 Transcript_17945/m.58103 type:complete len:203 (+) Transcript_17945:356-964(+)
MGLGRGLAQRRPTSARRRGRFDAGAWTRGARLLAAAHVPLQPRGRVGERSISNPNRRRGPPPLGPAAASAVARRACRFRGLRRRGGRRPQSCAPRGPGVPHVGAGARLAVRLSPHRAPTRAPAFHRGHVNTRCNIGKTPFVTPAGMCRTLAVAVAEAARSRGLAACLVGGTSNTLLVRGPARHRPGLYIWLELSVARAPLAR